MVLQKYNANIRPFSYIIYKDGPTIKAVNGTTGIVDYSGTNAATVINNTFGNLTTERTWKEVVAIKGNVTITTKIDMVSNCILDLRNCKITTLGNIIGINANTVNDSMIIGGVIDGNSQTDGNSSMRIINLNNCNRVTIIDTEIKNGGYYGLNLIGSNECTIDNIYSHDNYRHGIHLGADTSGRNMYNTVVNCRCSSNGVDGINDRGSTIVDAYIENTYVNNICTSNVEEGFQFGGGVDTATPKCNYYVANCVAIGNNIGFDIYSTKATLTNPIGVRNIDTGIRLRGCNGVSILNPIASDNGQTKYNGGIKVVAFSSTDSKNIMVIGGEAKNNSRNLYVSAVVSCDNITFADIDARDGIDTNVKITGTITNLKLRNITGYKTESNVLSGIFAIDSIGIKTVTIVHGLDITPNVQDCYLTVVQNTAVDDWTYNLLKIVSTNTTSTIAKINISQASKTIGATAKLALRVDNP